MQACVVLVRQEPWKTLMERALKARAVALSKHYYAADPRTINIVRASRAYDEFLKRYPSGDIEEALRLDPNEPEVSFHRANPGAV
jgi:hypothetical protein